MSLLRKGMDSSMKKGTEICMDVNQLQNTVGLLWDWQIEPEHLVVAYMLFKSGSKGGTLWPPFSGLTVFFGKFCLSFFVERMQKQMGSSVVTARKYASMLFKGRMIHIQKTEKHAGTIVILARTQQNSFYCGDSGRSETSLAELLMWIQFCGLQHLQRV